MSLWRHLARGVRVLADRPAADRDLSEEVRDYLEEAAAAHEARGLSPEAARRAARLEVGNPTVFREQVRAYGWENVVEAVAGDLRYALRRLRSAPSFALVAVLTLALGIGASTAIFSAVRPILFDPLPYPHGDRLVTISDRTDDGTPLAVTYGSYLEVRARATSFSDLAVMRPWQPTVTGAGEPERLEGQHVSANYFRVLGLGPAIGRGLDSLEDRPDGAREVVLSDGLWRRRFGGDSGIVGQHIELDDLPYTVVGVMPRGFENLASPSAAAWTLMRFDASLPTAGQEWSHLLRMIGRLRPGVSRAGATRELAAIAGHRIAAFTRPPWSTMGKGLTVTTLRDDVTHAARPALLAVLGAVLLLLAIACVNVTNLVLARGAQRHAELAMRAALGAARGRLVRQLLTESVLLALVGGALGLAVATGGLHALLALAPPELPRIGAIRISGAAFAFALVLSAVVGLATGLVPAVHASRVDLQTALQHGSRRTAAGQRTARRMLVVAEVALALVLLVSAGLLVRSLERLFAVDPGFAPAHLLTMEVQTAGPRFDDDSAAHRFFVDALAAVRRVPGVRSAAWVSQLPLSGDAELYGVHFQDSPEGHNAGSVIRYAVSPGYFETMGVALLRGRYVNEGDRAGAPLAAVFNASFAARMFPGMDPIGRRVHIGPDSGPWYSIVGIVADVKQLSLGTTQTDEVYLTMEQSWFVDRALSLVVRTEGAPAPLAPAVKQAVWSVDREQPILRVATMDAVLAASEAQRRFALVVFEVFAAAALVLAAIGIYGVLSGAVTERRREMGVRAALGASRRDVLALVLRQGMVLTVLGVVIGLAGAMASSRALVSLLFGITPLDPVTYVVVIGLLLGVSALACWLPAARAASVDPTIALRAE